MNHSPRNEAAPRQTSQVQRPMAAGTTRRIAVSGFATVQRWQQRCRKTFVLLCLVGCVFAGGTGAPAQSTQATISGEVTDVGGAAVPDATVVAKNTENGTSVSTKTSGSGVYTMPNLAVGSYSVTVTHTGFQTKVVAGIQLNAAQVLGLNLLLQVGEVTTSVTVTDERPAIETRNAQVGQTIETESVAELPLGNRSAMNVLALAGGVVFIDQTNYSLAGGRTQSSMTWLDGGSGQNIRLGVGQQLTSPPVDVVREIGIISNNYGAEFGGSGAGVVLQNTKSGTNAFHGSAYDFERNNAFDAPGYFTAAVNGVKTNPGLHYHIFGGTVGGPIWKNKTFFFGGYEGQRESVTSQTTLTVPSALQRQGDFSQTFTSTGTLIKIYDPSTTVKSGSTYTRTQFPGNKIPVLDPVAAAVLKDYPLPNRTPDNLAGANNFRANGTLLTPSNFFIAKGDHQLRRNDRITARYIYFNNSSTNISVYPLEGVADPLPQPHVHFYSIWGQWVHTINPTSVNDFRVLYENRYNSVGTHGLNQNIPSSLGLNGVATDAFPQFTVTGFTTLGPAQASRQQYPTHGYQAVDDLTLVRGHHSIKVGFEILKSTNSEMTLSTPSGSFTFSALATGLPGNTATGLSLASLLVGFPQSFAAATTERLERHSYYVAAFAQDDYSVTPYLTLNLGLRWDVDSAFIDDNNRFNSFDSNAINPVSNTPGVVTFAGLNGTPTAPFATDLNDFAPRLGFAYQPLHKPTTVVRGGLGVFFANPYDSSTQTNGAVLGFGLSAGLSSPDNGITAPFYLRNGVTVSPTAPILNSSFGAVPVGSAVTTNVTYFDTLRRNGYTYQYNLGLQQVLPFKFVAEVLYLGSVSQKLAAANRNLNQITPANVAAGHTTQSYRPFPQFNNVTVLASSNTFANYNAGIVHLSRRFNRGISFDTSYTFAKNLNNSDGQAGSELGSDGGPYSNLYHRAADYGPSSNDVRHQFVASGVFDVPVGQGRQFLNHGALSYVLGGWTLGAIWRIYTGPPFTVTTNTNNTNSFSSGAQRPNVNADPNLASGVRSPSLWLNVAAFSQPATGTFGNYVRNSNRAPNYASFDVSLIRNFRLPEKIDFQLRGEALNILNHTNFQTPASQFGASTFGTISSAYAARIIQVGGHISF